MWASAWQQGGEVWLSILSQLGNSRVWHSTFLGGAGEASRRLGSPWPGAGFFQHLGGCVPHSTMLLALG